jgi:hypothetical protein
MILRIRLLPVLLIIAAFLFLSGIVGAIKVGLDLAFPRQTCVSVNGQRHCGSNFEVQVTPDGKMLVLHPGDPGYEQCDAQGNCTVAPAKAAKPAPPHGDGR